MPTVTVPDVARAAIHDRWITEWDTTSPFVFENEADDALFEGDVAWTRLTVRNTATSQKTLGPKTNRRYRRDASIFVQVMSPLDEGMQGGAVLAQTARGIFEGERFSDLACNDGEIREIGSDGKWYVTNVEVFLDYEETK